MAGQGRSVPPFPALLPAWSQRQDSEREVNALLARIIQSMSPAQRTALDKMPSHERQVLLAKLAAQLAAAPPQRA